MDFILPPLTFLCEFLCITANIDLIVLVCENSGTFDIIPLLDNLTNNMVGKDNVTTKISELWWINIPPKNRKG